ncbi:MAG: tRNA (N6-threonylcarbamoyladenosine(37)-N6)-methyltransferase TrmO [Candidatus Lokiarchaeota archaeon]|nr:tRNA (N6-threonylcarbamoyladenosine(37)-N6)-methyltransferase TrmO [Candidatus Lokiarchaeota archaeon]
MRINFEAIGTIYTPYESIAPFQPIENAKGEFYIDLKEKYTKGIDQLQKFSHIYILFYLHKMGNNFLLKVTPPWISYEVGVFATRSPRRPNGIELSIVRLKKIKGHVLHISGIDVFSGTPVLDIKPYFQEFDVKSDANNGWMDDINNLNELKIDFTKRFLENT